MTAVFEPVRLARAAWELTQPQMFFEVDDLTTLPVPTAPLRSVAITSPTATAAPAAPTHSNGSGHAHLEGAREAGASQERS